MILESAFYQLLGNLLDDDCPREQCEAFLVGHMAMAVLLELTARNIPNPTRLIKLEKPYSFKEPPSRFRTDLYVKVPNMGTSEYFGNTSYGLATDNWIEATMFSYGTGSSGSIPKTQNTVRIALDLLRLCTLVEDTGDNARYQLLVFDRPPSERVALRYRGGGTREWLEGLLTPGLKEICFDLSQEPQSFRGTTNLELELKAWVNVKSFEPAVAATKQLYWGFLCNIISFTLTQGELSYEHEPQAPVDKKRLGLDNHSDIVDRLRPLLQASP